MLHQNIFSAERSLLLYKEKSHTRNTQELLPVPAPDSNKCVIFLMTPNSSPQILIFFCDSMNT